MENHITNYASTNHSSSAQLTAAPAISYLPRKPITASPNRWHQIMGYSNSEVISSLPNATVNCHIIKDATKDIIKDAFDQCEAYRLAKAKNIISRRPFQEYFTSCNGLRPVERIWCYAPIFSFRLKVY